MMKNDSQYLLYLHIWTDYCNKIANWSGREKILVHYWCVSRVMVLLPIKLAEREIPQ
jgi:hypothetical protein